MLIIKHTMAVTLEIGVGYLLAEFFANAFVVFRFFAPTRAVSTALFQSVFYHFYNFNVII